MGQLKFIENIVEKEMLDLHTAFLARVLSLSGNQAKIQPMGLTKEVGGTAKSYAPISSVPVTKQSQNKVFVEDGEITVSLLEAGDIVICVCCDRDITEAKCGKNVLPPVGHHNMSDCVIVGVL